MGVFDKLKNALFEEEYIEVEEKPKKKDKPKRERPVREKVEKKHTVKEDKPIAKKVVLPEKKEKVVDERLEKPIDEDFDTEPLLNNNEDSFKFPMVDDNDFSDSDNYVEKEERVTEREVSPNYGYDDYREKKYEDLPKVEKYSDNSYGHKTSSPYGIDESSKINVHEYGMYEKDKKIFRPSPIISPIYGVLDKNYKKEEIVTKKEVRLTSSYARENLSVDDVRNKAYGTLSDDIARGDILEDKKEEVLDDVKTDLLVDLSSSIDKPEVSEITMGDAEEYFQDLGLEYNIDYKDASKEKATGRRSQRESISEEVEKTENIDTTVVKPTVEKATESDNNDNLFDLIDSMYEEEN